MPGQTIGPYLILGEGNRDKLFIENLCQNRTITDLTVDFVKGNDNFGDHLTGLTAVPDYPTCRAILLVSDIDESAADSFKKIKVQIGDAGFPVPTSPLSMAEKEGFSSTPYRKSRESNELENNSFIFFLLSEVSIIS